MARGYGQSRSESPRFFSASTGARISATGEDNEKLDIQLKTQKGGASILATNSPAWQSATIRNSEDFRNGIDDIEEQVAVLTSRVQEFGDSLGKPSTTSITTKPFTTTEGTHVLYYNAKPIKVDGEWTIDSFDQMSVMIKKVASESGRSSIVEENPRRNFDPSQGIGGGAYESGQRLKAQLEAEGVTGIAGPLTRRSSIMEERTPTYTPDELREAKAKQKLAGQGGLYEGPGAVEARNERIKATERASAARRLEGSLNDAFKTDYKPKKRK
jgi:hypothetical protein